jgi:hypothetical protein
MSPKPSPFAIPEKCMDCSLFVKRYKNNPKLGYCSMNASMVSPNGPICTGFQCKEPIQSVGSIFYTKH